MPYIGNSPGTGTRNRFIFTATASQTTFSGADDNGKTLAYSDGDYVDVYLNGICLVPVDDYAATSKTSIVLTVGAAASDTLEVVAYDIATIADTVSKADGGQFDGDVTVNASFTVDNGSIKLDGNYPTNTGNVALGNTALDSLGAGNYNTAVGHNALTANTDGSNTAFGAFSLAAVTTGGNNVAVGREALEANTGDNNTALGYQSLTSNTASNNTAVGYQAGYAATTEGSSVYVGYQAGVAANGLFNTFVGTESGHDVTSGVVNTFVGYDSGSQITTGSKNVIIGNYNGNENSIDLRTLSNNIVLSDGDGTPLYIYEKSREAHQFRTDKNYLARLTIHPSSATVSNGGTVTLTSGENGAMHVYMYDRGSGTGAVFWANYAGTVTLLNSNGSTAVSTTQNNSGSFNVYKSANSHSMYFQNNAGTARQMVFMLIGGRVND